MPNPLIPIISSLIRERGPLTVAEFMELALYHPEHGYYARAPQRSGRAGDFFTSVDVGALFGEMLAVQIEEMWRVLQEAGAAGIDLVEAAAGNGRLTRDVLQAASVERLDFLPHARVTLVERSAPARAAHTDTLAGLPGTPESRADLPVHLTGVIFANELLDALPVHVVESTGTGLVEIYVGERDGTLVEITGPISDQALTDYVTRMHVQPDQGTRLEVGLEAVRWVEEAAAALERGFILLFDYGHEARELYSGTHSAGTLTSYRRHTVDARHWIHDPGEADLTSHVNLTAIRLAAEARGLTTIGLTDQTYFLIGLGIVDRLSSGADRAAVSRRLAARTLLMPGGLGSTMKVLAFAKNLGTPALRGLSSGRMT